MVQNFKTWGISILALVALLAACSSPQKTVTTIVQIPNTGPTQAAPSATPVVTETAQAATLTPGGASAKLTGTQAPAAPACSTPAALTPAVTEGPFFKAGSPERSSLLDSGVTGQKLVLTGYVLTADCKPVAHALVDFWQANAQGQYDNAGYSLRGHQFTDANGRYQLETIVPGLYPGRTEHIHVKVQAPNGPVLTTQLFFPGVQDNSQDGIFNQALLVQVLSSDSSSMQAAYNFVVR